MPDAAVTKVMLFLKEYSNDCWRAKNQCITSMRRNARECIMTVFQTNQGLFPEGSGQLVVKGDPVDEMTEPKESQESDGKIEESVFHKTGTNVSSTSHTSGRQIAIIQPISKLLTSVVLDRARRLSNTRRLTYLYCSSLRPAGYYYHSPVQSAVKGDKPKICFPPPSAELEDIAHRETLIQQRVSNIFCGSKGRKFRKNNHGGPGAGCQAENL
ncbi:hypothetical protein J6590_094650 [Homalodisca vitripennis]|nr:hypothetical protein J6590_094650 [Homalodisca vitripennis]